MTEYIDGIFPCRKENPFVFHEILSDIVHMGGFFFLPVISLGEDYPGFDAMMDLFTKVGFPRTLDPKRQNYTDGKSM